MTGSGRQPGSRPRPLTKGDIALKDPNYFYLTLTLVAVFFFGPLLIGIGIVGDIVVSAFLLMALLIAASAVSSRDSVRRLLKALAIGTFVTHTLAVAGGEAAIGLVGTGLYATFFAVVLAALLAHVMAPSPVDNNKLFGAVSVYLVAGAMWGLVYILLEGLQPGAFRGIEGNESLMYFSLVTLTTLGYGDVTPVSPIARTLAALEAVCGQVYLAILVAWLVGMRASRGPRDV